MARKSYSEPPSEKAVMLHKIYLGEASVVAIVVAIISYLLLCALVAQLTGRKKGRP